MVIKQQTYSANAAHSVVDAPRSQSALDNLKAPALAEHQVLGRHAHILKGDVTVAVGSVVVAVHLEHPLDGDAGQASGD